MMMMMMMLIMTAMTISMTVVVDVDNDDDDEDDDVCPFLLTASSASGTPFVPLISSEFKSTFNLFNIR